MNPVNDIKTIGKDLEQIYGYQIDYLINPTKEEILLRVRHYASKKYGGQDQLMIFIVVHGVFDDVTVEGYLVAGDSRKGDIAKSSYLSHSTMRTIINNM